MLWFSKNNGDSVQTPVLKAGGIGRLSGAGAIALSSGQTITFDADAADAQLNEGTTADASNYLVLGGGDSWTAGHGVTSVYINQACGYNIS